MILTKNEGKDSKMYWVRSKLFSIESALYSYNICLGLEKTFSTYGRIVVLYSSLLLKLLTFIVNCFFSSPHIKKYRYTPPHSTISLYSVSQWTNSRLCIHAVLNDINNVFFVRNTFNSIDLIQIDYFLKRPSSVMSLFFFSMVI